LILIGYVMYWICSCKFQIYLYKVCAN